MLNISLPVSICENEDDTMRLYQSLIQIITISPSISVIPLHILLLSVMMLLHKTNKGCCYRSNALYSFFPS